MEVLEVLGVLGEWFTQCVLPPPSGIGWRRADNYRGLVRENPRPELNPQTNHSWRFSGATRAGIVSLRTSSFILKDPSSA